MAHVSRLTLLVMVLGACWPLGKNALVVAASRPAAYSRLGCDEAPLVPLSDVMARLSKTPAVQVEAVVVYVSECPPCPPGAQCEPCEPPYVLLAPEKDTPAKEQVRVLVNRYLDKDLAVGSRYRLRLDMQPLRWGSDAKELHGSCFELARSSQPPIAG
jgi:hypothetical protein